MGRNYGEVGNFNEESVSIDMNMALYELPMNHSCHLALRGLLRWQRWGSIYQPKPLSMLADMGKSSEALQCTTRASYIFLDLIFWRLPLPTW